jgi:hypothetical protein
MLVFTLSRLSQTLQEVTVRLLFARHIADFRLPIANWSIGGRKLAIGNWKSAMIYLAHQMNMSAWNEGALNGD